MVKISDEFFDGDAENAQLARQNAVTRLGRLERAMQMKISGADWPEIASELGYGTAEAAAKDVHAALEEALLTNEQFSVEVVRMVQLKRLDTIYQGLEPGIIRGNSKSGDVAVKVIDRIARLTGADAPLKTQTKVEITVQEITDEIELTKREIAARRAELEEAGVIDVEIEE